MRVSAQPRFTAVGRVACSTLVASESEASEGSSDMARAMPKAALTPISGAPRTRMRRMAWATASVESSRTVSKTWGRRDWSMMRTALSDPSRQMLR
jgi:hypothetical protein